MKAVAERRAADGARHGVDRLNARIALMHQAGALHIVAQCVNQRLINILRFVRGWTSIRVLDARAGLFQHVVHARTRPWAHPQICAIHKSKREKTKNCRINPTVDRNVRRIEKRGFADRRRTAGIAVAPLPLPCCRRSSICRFSRSRSGIGLSRRSLCSRSLSRCGSRLFGRHCARGQQQKAGQPCRAENHRSFGPSAVHIHTLTHSLDSCAHVSCSKRGKGT